MKRLTVSIAALSLFTCIAPGQPEKIDSTEQRSFGLGGLEDRVVRNPVQLSEADVEALSKDKLMQEELQQNPPVTLSRKGLETAVVHLHGPHERDLVVIGSGAPYIGANIGPFWIVRELPGGPKVVFSVTALEISIRSTKHNGMDDVECFASTGRRGLDGSFRFNGQRYSLVRSRDYAR